MLVVCALTLVAEDQRSASDTPLKLKKRFKGLVACMNSRDHVLVCQWVDVPVKVVRHQGGTSTLPQYEVYKKLVWERG